MEDLLYQNLQEFVFDQNRLVTYKWLSNELSIPVNFAKQLLYQFATENENKVKVVYFVSGLNKQGVSVTLASEEKLNEIKKSYERIHSQHVYSVQVELPKTAKEIWEAEYSQQVSSLSPEHPYLNNKNAAIEFSESLKKQVDVPKENIPPNIKERNAGEEDKKRQTPLQKDKEEKPKEQTVKEEKAREENKHEKKEQSKKSKSKGGIASFFQQKPLGEEKIERIAEKQTADEGQLKSEIDKKENIEVKLDKDEDEDKEFKRKKIRKRVLEEDEDEADNVEQRIIQTKLGKQEDVKVEISVTKKRRTSGGKDEGMTKQTKTPKKSSKKKKIEENEEAEEDMEEEEEEEEIIQVKEQKGRKVQNSVQLLNEEDEEEKQEREEREKRRKERELEREEMEKKAKEKIKEEKERVNFPATDGDRKTMKKKVVKTFTNAKGYTVTEEVWEEFEVTDEPSSNPATSLPPASPSTPSAQSNKQSNIMSFFKKK